MSHYDTLGVDPKATLQQIKQAYFEKALQLHPDINPGLEKDAGKFQEVSNAYEVSFAQADSCLQRVSKAFTICMKHLENNWSCHWAHWFFWAEMEDMSPITRSFCTETASLKGTSEKLKPV